MRTSRLLVAVLVATVLLAGCPDGGDGSGYVSGDDPDEPVVPQPGPADEIPTQASSANTSAFVPGSTNT